MLHDETRGVRREVFRGFTKSSWRSGGGGAPEDFEINAFQRPRTPASLSFLFIQNPCYFLHT